MRPDELTAFQQQQPSTSSCTTYRLPPLERFESHSEQRRPVRAFTVPHPTIQHRARVIREGDSKANVDKLSFSTTLREDDEWTRLVNQEKEIEREQTRLEERVKSAYKCVRSSDEQQKNEIQQPWNVANSTTNYHLMATQKIRRSSVPISMSAQSPMKTTTASALDVDVCGPSNQMDLLLAHVFIAPLTRLFRHYRGLAPSASRASLMLGEQLMSLADFLVFCTDMDLVPSLMHRTNAQKLFLSTLKTKQNLTGFDQDLFLRALHSAAQMVQLLKKSNESVEAEMQRTWLLLQYIKHRCALHVLGPIKLGWPEINFPQALQAVKEKATQGYIEAERTKAKDKERCKDRMREKGRLDETERELLSTASSSFSSRLHSASSRHSSVSTASGNGIGNGHLADPATKSRTAVASEAEAKTQILPFSEDAERKERKRRRLRAQVERYKAEQAEREQKKIEEDLKSQIEKEARDAGRRDHERHQREEDKRKIAEYRAKRAAEVEEARRAEIERIFQEEREKKRQLEMYMTAKVERQRLHEEQQRKRLLHFQASLDASFSLINDDRKDISEEKKTRKTWKKNHSRLSSLSIIDTERETPSSYSQDQVSPVSSQLEPSDTTSKAFAEAQESQIVQQTD